MRSFDEFLSAKNEALNLNDLRSAVRGVKPASQASSGEASSGDVPVTASTSKPQFGKKGTVGKKDTAAQPQVNQQGEIDLNAFKKS